MGRLLLQLRSQSKDTQPGKWDCSVGGHVGYGQSYEQAASRETLEELGVELDFQEPLYASRIRNAVESENIRTYLCLHSGPFRPNPEEIDALRFWTRAEIQAALGSGKFTPNFEEEFAAFTACPQGHRLT
jgi:isopentenyldiphosphate isomerase